MVRALLFVAALGCLTTLTAAQQAGCSSLPTSTEVPILIVNNYFGTGQGTPPTIMLQMSPEGFTFRVVCSSLSGIRNQYRFVSIVAYFTTSDASVSPGGVPIYGQFEFECVNSMWSATSTLLDITLFNRIVLTGASPAVNANITTSCAYCLKPSRSERVSDTVNHCSACTGCSQPLCYTTDISIPSPFLSQTCCNYYSSDGVTCTTACPSSSFPDANRTCVSCTLTCQNGGTLRTDMCGCNCPAVTTGSSCSTCLCKNGGNCTASGTCSCPTVYSGQLCDTCIRTCPTGNYLNNSTCSCAKCPLYCKVCSNSNTCTTCSDNYTVNAQNLCDPICPANCISCTTPNDCTTCKSGYNPTTGLCDPICPANCISCTTPNNCTTCKSGYNPTTGLCVPEVKSTSAAVQGGGCDGACIGGIIGGILGAVLLAGIIAAVVAVAYFVMKNPATATSAVPGAGLSGVAKDNPLYLDPKIVEDSVAQ